jgi:hypothetical protein
VHSTVIASARACLIGFIATSLLNLPVMAAGVPSVGMVVSSENALLSHTLATRGAGVYPGDTLTTQPDGSLRFASGLNQMYLLESTQATMAREGNAVRAKMERGTINFSGTPGQFEIETPIGLIRGAGSDRAFGQVAMFSPTKIQVSAYEGELAVAGVDGTTKSIAAGETFVASLDSGGGPTDPGILGVGRPRKINWRRVAATAIIAGGSAFAAYEFYKEFTESCSKRNCGR